MRFNGSIGRIRDGIVLSYKGDIVNMGYCDCKYCKKFIGDCGNHFKDSYGHINFDIPSESVLDKFNNPTCFEETRTKYKELYDRMKEDGICGYEFPDDEDFNNVLRALIIADREERKKR